MKTRIIALGLSILTISLISCGEDPKETQVWGIFYCNECSSNFEAQGTLAESRGDYYGWCEITAEGINIAVGQRNPMDPDFTSEFYFEVRGIQGPAAEGVYAPNGTSYLDDPSLYTTFESMYVMNTNQWTITQDDITDPSQCKVRLFATPLEGELTPEEFGSESFEYFVNVECTGIAVDSTQGATLTGTSLQAFFDECR